MGNGDSENEEISIVSNVVWRATEQEPSVQNHPTEKISFEQSDFKIFP